MKPELQDILQHHGIKGMHWGIRRNRNRPGGADGKEESVKIKDKRTKLKKHLDSLKRERQWHRDLRNFHNMSTEDVNKIAKRISLENDYRKLARTKGVGTKHDQEDYLRREFMSTQELSRKVTRLKAKESLTKSVYGASKPQRDFGMRVVNTAGGLALKYAKNKSIGPKDLFDTWTKNEPVKDQIPKAVTKKAVDLIDKAVKARVKKRQSTP